MTETASLDYQRVERAIEYLDAHRIEQPTLNEVAAELGLSPFHFQRLFKRWAGVSPKRFLQYLTLEDAKERLRGSATVLEASFDTGLSGPSRLHDLFVTLEGVSPGEFRARGQGLTIHYGVHPTPFGEGLIALTERGICWLSFIDHEGPAAALAELEQHWPRAQLIEQPQQTAATMAAIFNSAAPRRRAGSFRLLVKGSQFELRVWRALLKIPSSAVVSYGDVARALGSPTASRAVGQAVGRNPVAVLIPCHRVLRKSGEPWQYRWGRTRKRALLGWEAARS